MECEICLETVKNKDIITCPYCQMKSCNKCVKEYLMNYGGLECSNCKKKINITFIANHFTKKWLKDDYPKQYSKFCLLSEDSLLNPLMNVINIYNLLSNAKQNNYLKIVHNYLYLKYIINNSNYNNNNNKNNTTNIYQILDRINSFNYKYYIPDNNINFCDFLPCIKDKIINNDVKITFKDIFNDLKDDINIFKNINKDDEYKKHLLFINKNNILKNIPPKKELSSEEFENYFEEKYIRKKFNLLELILIFYNRINDFIVNNNNDIIKQLLDNANILYNFNNGYLPFPNIYSLIYTLLTTSYVNYEIYKFYRNITLDKKKDSNNILKFYEVFNKKIQDNSISNRKCINKDCRGFLKEIKDEITEEEFNKHNDKKEKDIEDYRYIKKNIKEKNEDNYINKFYKINYLECKLCNKKVCYDCMKELDDNHKCNNDDIANISAIRLGAKSCPGCGIPIFKSDGCDHMFCISCHCMFNWSDLKITKTTTNPLYYEWLRSRGITPQRSDRQEYETRLGYCDNNMYNSYTLNNELRKYNVMNYDKRYFNLDYIFENIKNYPNKTINDYNKIRIQYLLNVLSEEEYKKIISKYDIDFYYINEYNEIYNTFRFNLNDILHDLFNKLDNNYNYRNMKTYENNKSNIINENAKIIDNYINDFNINMNNFKKLSILNKTTYLIDNNWLIYENINHTNNKLSKLKFDLYLKVCYNLFVCYYNTCYILNYKDYDIFDNIKYITNSSDYYYNYDKQYKKFIEKYNSNKDNYEKLISLCLEKYKLIDFNKCIIDNYEVYDYKYKNHYRFKKYLDNLLSSIENDIIEYNNNNIRNIFINANNLIKNLIVTNYTTDKHYNTNYAKLLFETLKNLIDELKD